AVARPDGARRQPGRAGGAFSRGGLGRAGGHPWFHRGGFVVRRRPLPAGGTGRPLPAAVAPGPPGRGRPHAFTDPTAHRSLADVLRGLARRSSGAARVTSSFVAE